MAKQLDFEISTRMNIVEPEGFTAATSKIGAQVFDRQPRSGFYVEDDDGQLVRPKDAHFRVIDRFRYTHFDRVIEPYGRIGIEYMNLLLRINPALRDEETIGGIDLESDISKELYSRLGQCSIKRDKFTFVDIEDVPSDRNPDSRVFVLRQKEDEMVINPLKLITDFVRESIKGRSRIIHDLGTEASHKVEDGLIIAITNDSNPDKIENFKEKFKTQVIGDENIIAIAKNVEIDSGMKF